MGTVFVFSGVIGLQTYPTGNCGVTLTDGLECDSECLKHVGTTDQATFTIVGNARHICHGQYLQVMNGVLSSIYWESLVLVSFTHIQMPINGLKTLHISFMTNV